MPILPCNGSSTTTAHEEPVLIVFYTVAFSNQYIDIILTVLFVIASGVFFGGVGVGSTPSSEKLSPTYKPWCSIED